MNEAHENSASWLARDARAVWHPFSHGATEPELLNIQFARGAWLTLGDGRRILDGIASWWTSLHGHGHPKIVEAIARQAERLDHVLFAGATHEPAVELAEKLIKIAPPGLSKVFYSDNGSTAVEVALKIAIQYCYLRGERRRRIVALDGGYHGDTFGAMAAGESSIFTKPFADYLFHVDRIVPPVRESGVASALESAAKLLEQHATEIAALLCEPVLQGASGMRLHPPAYVRGLRALCSQFGILMIADEVMTGFGRTGKLFACEHAGISPDLLCLAKGLTGGTLPLAATLCREEIFEVFQTGDRSRAFFHGHSFTGNPIACAAALASMELTLQKDFLQNVSRIGARVSEKVNLLKNHPGVADVRSLGLLTAVELSGGGGYLLPGALGIRKRAVELGALLRPLGPVLYTLPPACLEDREAAQLGDILYQLAMESIQHNSNITIRGPRE